MTGKTSPEISGTLGGRQQAPLVTLTVADGRGPPSASALVVPNLARARRSSSRLNSRCDGSGTAIEIGFVHPSLRKRACSESGLRVSRNGQRDRLRFHLPHPVPAAVAGSRLFGGVLRDDGVRSGCKRLPGRPTARA